MCPDGYARVARLGKRRAAPGHERSRGATFLERAAQASESRRNWINSPPAIVAMLPRSHRPRTPPTSKPCLRGVGNLLRGGELHTIHDSSPGIELPDKSEAIPTTTHPLIQEFAKLDITKERPFPGVTGTTFLIQVAQASESRRNWINSPPVIVAMLSWNAAAAPGSDSSEGPNALPTR
ncbi:hypothetical protein HUW46_05927 [Amycolatopsis sp. CA-230715]|nr:hypothetical protein HUW46_05927 [Amycolatopsis sp. CA-230715]